MALADAETALWDKACSVRNDEDPKHDGMCGHPFGLDYYLEKPERRPLGKPALGKEAEWWKLTFERGQMGMGHHL